MDRRSMEVQVVSHDLRTFANARLAVPIKLQHHKLECFGHGLATLPNYNITR
jgi:hypothetical protein